MAVLRNSPRRPKPFKKVEIPAEDRSRRWRLAPGSQTKSDKARLARHPILYPGGKTDQMYADDVSHRC